MGLDEAREYFHNVHQTIQHFTSDFLSQATKCLWAGNSGELHIPTSSEIYRVQRSLYYYELFCLIWGNGNNVPADWDLNVSWGLSVEFSPCMSEQVASVYEYLLRKLSIGIKLYFHPKSLAQSRLNNILIYAVFTGMDVQDVELGKEKRIRLDTLDQKDVQKDILVSPQSNYP